MARTAMGEGTARSWDAVAGIAASIGTAWRFARVLAHFCRGWLQAVVVLPVTAPETRTVLVQSWCVKMLRLCGVTMETTGPRPDAPVLIVSNHVSWLDMVAIQLLCPSRFVAKHEVSGWPVIGAIADRLGTVYVDRRSARGAAAAAKEVEALLRAGETVVVFPEGTTTDGSTLQAFRASLLQAPIEAQARVQPVALAYREAGTGLPCRRASYTGDDILFESIWRTLSGRTKVRLAFGPVIDACGHHRRGLAVLLHAEVDALRRS